MLCRFRKRVKYGRLIKEINCTPPSYKYNILYTEEEFMECLEEQCPGFQKIKQCDGFILKECNAKNEWSERIPVDSINRKKEGQGQ